MVWAHQSQSWIQDPGTVFGRQAACTGRGRGLESEAKAPRRNEDEHFSLPLKTALQVGEEGTRPMASEAHRGAHFCPRAWEPRIPEAVVASPTTLDSVPQSIWWDMEPHSLASPFKGSKVSSKHLF